MHFTSISGLFTAGVLSLILGAQAVYADGNCTPFQKVIDRASWAAASDSEQARQLCGTDKSRILACIQDCQSGAVKAYGTDYGTCRNVLNRCCLNADPDKGYVCNDSAGDACFRSQVGQELAETGKKVGELANTASAATGTDPRFAKMVSWVKRGDCMEFRLGISKEQAASDPSLDELRWAKIFQTPWSLTDQEKASGKIGDVGFGEKESNKVTLLLDGVNTSRFSTSNDIVDTYQLLESGPADARGMRQSIMHGKMFLFQTREQRATQGFDTMVFFLGSPDPDEKFQVHCQMLKEISTSTFKFESDRCYGIDADTQVDGIPACW